VLARQIGAYLDHLAVERGAARNTLGAYRRDLDRYRNFLTGRGITGLDNASESDVAEFTMALRAGGTTHPPLAASSVAAPGSGKVPTSGEQNTLMQTSAAECRAVPECKAAALSAVVPG